MTQRTIDSRVAAASLFLAFVVLGCNDRRLRELGYTSDPVTSSEEEGYDPEPTCAPNFIDSDTLLAAVADDVAAAPAESRPFLRYLSFASRVDAGVCPQQLASERNGAVRLLNALSRAPTMVAPRVGGPAESVLAIDLRDYALTSAVDVNGTTYADGWEAFIGENPYAIEFAGEQAAAVAGATGTRVPVLDATALILAPANGALYYALLGTPATLGELRASVGLSSELDPALDGGLRTSVQVSRILRSYGNVRVLDRYAIATGSYWEATAIDAGSFFSDPLHAQPDAQRLVTYSLPNGTFAFAVYDAEGQRRESTEFVLDTNRDDFAAHVPDSCSNCHARGLIPGTDVAGDIILGHQDQFAPDVLAAYRAAPSNSERAELFNADSARHQQALSSIGIDEGADPFAMRFLAAIQDVTLDVAAADLLVTRDVLRARLGELPAPMRVLGFDLVLSRQRFGELYRAAYCVLHADDGNPPPPEACAAP